MGNLYPILIKRFSIVKILKNTFSISEGKLK